MANNNYWLVLEPTPLKMMTRRRSHFLVTGENDEQFSVGKSYIWLVVSTYPIYGDSMV